MTAKSTYQTLLYETSDDHVATVTLNRPEVMNAFNPPYSDASPCHSAPAESKGGTRGGEETKTIKKHTIITDDFDRAIQVAKTSEKLLLVNFTGLL